MTGFVKMEIPPQILWELVLMMTLKHNLITFRTAKKYGKE
jgi:hypothetical protein